MNKVDKVEILLPHAGDINERDISGTAPLHIASATGQVNRQYSLGIMLMIRYVCTFTHN